MTHSCSIVLLSCRTLAAGATLAAGWLMAAEPLPLSKAYWKDPAFLKAFNASYRIEARIEPSITTEQRGVLVKLQDLMADGKREQAIQLLADSELTKDSAALTFNLANLQLEEGEMEKAIASYEKAIRSFPSFRRAHRNLGLARVREQQWDGAVTHLTEAVRLGDSEGLTYGLLGYCRLAREQYASALQAYRLAKLSEPNVAEWSAGIAQCLQQMGQHEEAIALLDEVTLQRPLEASYAVLKANVHLQLDQLDAATKSLELSHRLGVLGADATLQLAQLHLRGGRLVEAKQVMDSAFANADALPGETAIVRLLQIAVIEQQWLLAKALLERVPNQKSGRVLRLAKARYLISSEEDIDAGAKLLRDLTKEDPTDGEALLALAKHLVDSGQPSAAELIYERAALDPEHTFAACAGLIRLHASQSHYRKALEAVNRALSVKPDEALEDYRKALQRTLEASR